MPWGLGLYVGNSISTSIVIRTNVSTSISISTRINFIIRINISMSISTDIIWVLVLVLAWDQAAKLTTSTKTKYLS